LGRYKICTLVNHLVVTKVEMTGGNVPCVPIAMPEAVGDTVTTNTQLILTARHDFIHTIF
jgi:hypothetical protein